MTLKLSARRWRGGTTVTSSGGRTFLSLSLSPPPLSLPLSLSLSLSLPLSAHIFVGERQTERILVTSEHRLESNNITSNTYTHTHTHTHTHTRHNHTHTLVLLFCEYVWLMH